MFDFHKRCQAEIEFLRRQVRGLQERNDRLVESLARKEGAQLQLPIESYQAREPEPGPASGPGAEVVNTWWRSMCAGGRISSPVPEEKVSAPNN